MYVLYINEQAYIQICYHFKGPKITPLGYNLPECVGMKEGGNPGYLFITPQGISTV